MTSVTKARRKAYLVFMRVSYGYCWQTKDITCLPPTGNTDNHPPAGPRYDAQRTESPLLTVTQAATTQHNWRCAVANLRQIPYSPGLVYQVIYSQLPHHKSV